MKIALITDTWFPQINGVVTTLNQTVKTLEKRGYSVDLIEPCQFFNIPCPTYPEIKLAFPIIKLYKRLKKLKPNYIHIANEGPLGVAAQIICRFMGWPFTTAFHTKLAEYTHERFKFFPVWLGYIYLKLFHKKSKKVLVPSPSVKKELEDRNFKNIVSWNRGVNTLKFSPGVTETSYKKPVELYVGRVSVEKNLDAWLSLPTEGTKVVVGDGPYLKELRSKYPNAVFTGYKKGKDLINYYRSADVFVFPSKSDTFGLVQLEALACGLPIAAYPVTGPLDVVTEEVGCLRESLEEAINIALTKDPKKCRNYALTFSWDKCIDTFIDNLQKVNHEL